MVTFRNEAAEFVFVRTYSRWVEEQNRRETWDETVQRFIHFLKEERDDVPEKVYRKIQEYMLSFEVMPSMRAVWAAGPAARADNTCMYNCLAVETEFVTNTGVKSFKDFSDGDETTVLTHTGAFKRAVVRSYGVQPLNKILLRKGGRGNKHVVYATSNHRWLLHDGTETTALQPKDHILSAPNVFDKFDYGEAEPLEKLYWCYGYTYGDGTKVKDKSGEYKYSMVRLCGSDAERFRHRFEEVGFKTSTTASLDGDFFAYTGSYLKTLPDLDKEHPSLIRAFVAGLLDADGHKSCNNKSTRFDGIQLTGIEQTEFVRRAFPTAGMYVLSETDKTGQVTNYGVRKPTIDFSLNHNLHTESNAGWYVDDVAETNRVEQVWCLEVEDDHSFVLPFGVATGNCSFRRIDSVDAFAECLYILMCGTGFGFSVRKEDVDKLPEVPALKGQSIGTYVVDDSRVGWADSTKHLLTALYAGKDVDMDYTPLRAKGARLKTMGGRSSGPAPLINLHNYIRELFSQAQGRRLTTDEAHDLCCQIAEIVVVGGVRRSSEISLSDLEDERMRDAKIWPFPVRRSMANNSAIYETKPDAVTFLKEWAALAASGTGERGIFNLAGARECAPARRDGKLIAGTNPCGEIMLRDCEFCNLSEVVVREEDDLDSLLEKVTTAAWIGVIQSTFTYFPYLNDRWAKNCNEERLLGVSLTGQMDNPTLLTPDALKALRNRVNKTARHAAKILGINTPAATTCVKPSGTVSQLVDSASGVHPRYSKYYIRRYRISATDPLLYTLRDQGMKAKPEVGQRRKDWNAAARGESSACPIYVDGEEWSADKVVTWVLEFPVQAPKNAVLRDSMTALDQLEWYKKIQENWCEHNASMTVYVRDHEWFEVGNWVYRHWHMVNGISFLPYDGGKYELAPYEEIDKKTFDDMKAKLPAIDYALLSKYENEDGTSGAKSYACTGDRCELT